MTYTEDELIAALQDAVEEDGRIYEVLNDKTNDHPTSPTYYKHFGGMDEAFEEAGLPARDKWAQTGDRSHSFPIREALDSCDGYEPDADGYVYVLNFERQSDNERYVYVGSTEQELVERISCHRSESGAFTAPKQVNGVMVKVPRHRHRSEIVEIVEVHSLYVDDYDVSDEMFGGVVGWYEKRRHNELVLEYGPDSIAGGN